MYVCMYVCMHACMYADMYVIKDYRFVYIIENRVLLLDLWTFRDLTLSRVVLSRPMFGPFATRYFSHPFDPSRVRYLGS